MLIRLTLVGIDKIQKKCSFRTRLVGLMKTKEYFFGRHFCNRSIGLTKLSLENCCTQEMLVAVNNILLCKAPSSFNRLINVKKRAYNF